MEQLLTACGHQLTGATDCGEMVVLKQGGRFLQFLLQGPGGLQLVVIRRPNALPVEAEGTQANHRNTETGEHPRGDAVQPGQQGGLALNPTGGEGALEHLQGPRAARTRTTPGPISRGREAETGPVR